MAQKEILYQGSHYALSYEILHPQAQKDIVFLHGWGSNKSVMKQAFGRVFENFRHIYIDMPGFGNSTTDQILTTADYAAIIGLLLDALGVEKTLIIGHSFGGKVATLLQPKTLVLLSSAGIVQPKPFAVRFKIRLFKLLKKIGLGSLYRLFATKDVEGMPKNMYETLKNVVDEDFSPIFACYPNKARIFWGEADTATPLASGRTIAGLIPKNSFHPLAGDHYFFLEHARFIADAIGSESVAEA